MCIRDRDAVIVCRRGENARDFHYFKIFIFHLWALWRVVLCVWIAGQSATVRKGTPFGDWDGGQPVPPPEPNKNMQFNQSRTRRFAFTSGILTPNGARWQSFFCVDCPRPLPESGNAYSETDCKESFLTFESLAKSTTFITFCSDESLSPSTISSGVSEAAVSRIFDSSADSEISSAFQ